MSDTNLLPQEAELREALIELTDKHFPKGDKGRGQAMVLIAESLSLISDHTRKARLDELTIIHERFIAGQDYEFNKWLNIRSRALKQPTVEEE